MLTTLIAYVCASALMNDCQVYALGQWQGPGSLRQCEAARQIYLTTLRADTPHNRLTCEVAP